MPSWHDKNSFIHFRMPKFKKVCTISLSENGTDKLTLLTVVIDVITLKEVFIEKIKV